MNKGHMDKTKVGWDQGGKWWGKMETTVLEQQ